MKSNDIIYGALAIPYSKNNGKYKFLLLKHQKGFWTFPGGAVDEKDDSLKSALIRELEEEIGLKTKDTSILVETGEINEFVYDDLKPERSGKKGETHYFLLELYRDDKFSSFDKIIDWGWFTKGQVIKLLPYDDEKEVIREVIKKFLI